MRTSFEATLDGESNPSLLRILEEEWAKDHSSTDELVGAVTERWRQEQPSPPATTWKLSSGGLLSQFVILELETA